MTQQTTHDFHAVARLPLPGDNVAIATRQLPAGSFIRHRGAAFNLPHTVLVGHRFALAPIAPGEPLLSWGVPFGIATQPIPLGAYVRNAGMIEALNGRALDFSVPQQPNFQDRIVPFVVDEAHFRPGQQVARHPTDRTFQGYPRTGGRGVGTRNSLVILGTTSRSGGFARALAQRLQAQLADVPNLDGIVPIAHTEGSGYARLNNRAFLLRTLAGLIVHPNVAGVLVADVPGSSSPQRISNRELQQFMQENGYPLAHVPHQFFTRTGDWQADLQAGEATVRGWLPRVTAQGRTAASLAHLSIALQCGGSDAFSGVSGNPLASELAKEVIRYGGRANLAETDELIGSEAYALQNVRDLPTAQAFLDFVAEFKERLSWHGQSAEGNPSGGNKLRGLYNIALKSIGAAMKRHPDVRLDWVVDYAQSMTQPGYYFMNSPGNDLESIAGQVAGGSNLIIFVTGNGSITNFPFVPTLKVMTTTQRYELLSAEMDVNAGRYLDGTPMAELATESLDLLVAIASGQPSKGERAGHSQISIWRNWQQQDASRLPEILARPRPSGEPLDIKTGEPVSNGSARASADVPRPGQGRLGLILPTSLCAGQIARLAAQRLNQPDSARPFARFAALVHTEGCGVAFASTREIYAQTVLGYATHPLVAACLFLEHGCEKAHNDYIHSLLAQAGRTPQEFGWASVQLDGGIQQVLAKIDGYFHSVWPTRNASPAKLCLGLLAEETPPPPQAESLARLAQAVVAAGGSVVTPGGGPLMQAAAFRDVLGLRPDCPPSLAYGQAIRQPGFHLMETPTGHWTETLSGLGATGTHLILAGADAASPGHPFVSVLLLGADIRLAGDPAAWPGQMLAAITATLAGDYRPQTLAHSHTDFQLTRGLLGIST